MRNLYDHDLDYSSCGVGFITNKHSKQTHELLDLAHQALCKIPHRGGMSAEGIGDGAGVNVDISLNFFRFLTGRQDLVLGQFGVANFFYPSDLTQHSAAEKLITKILADHDLETILWRDVEVDSSSLNSRSAAAQLAIRQVVFLRPPAVKTQADFEKLIHKALEEIEYPAFTEPKLKGFYPLSMSSRTQVYKGRLNSWEVIPYFHDLSHPEHHIHTLFFHTRFSTNTEPNPMFAQPFRRMAHNGELNTDRKNRLSEEAIARSHNKQLIFPKGQSDSARLDQTMARRIIEDDLAIDKAALAMMPPAWENDDKLPGDVRDMLEYFSLSEEKNDGPAALIFGDGIKVGARLDRLGLRPLRSVETHDYLAVMSEAGQIDFPSETVIKRGRIEAGGMIVFDHEHKTVELTDDVLKRLAKERDYSALLEKARFALVNLPEKTLVDLEDDATLNLSARHVAYSMNQESFKFLLDPMLQSGMEKISAMGYGLAPNALNRDEGGMSRYFSQRFAQVTNPPLDSIREADGMTLRVALGRKPNFTQGESKQLVINSPILQPQQLSQIYAQESVQIETVNTLFTPDYEDASANQQSIRDALEDVCDRVEALAKSQCGIVVLTDRRVSAEHAALPAMLVISAVNQRLIRQGLRFHVSVIYETGQAASTHDIACLLGFGASAVCPLTVYHRARELFSDEAGVIKGLNKFQKAVEKALMKTMGKFGLCTAESYIGGEFFEANFIDTKDPDLAQIFPNIHSPVGGAQFADIAKSAADWHQRVASVQSEAELPLLGLFKERNEGAGHSFGNTAVREYINMTEEPISYVDLPELEPALTLPSDISYRDLGYEKLEPAQIDKFSVTKAYRSFSLSLHAERQKRPAALRDVLDLPVDLKACESIEDFNKKLAGINLLGNRSVAFQGLQITQRDSDEWSLQLQAATESRHQAFADALLSCFGSSLEVSEVSEQQLVIKTGETLTALFSTVITAPEAIDLNEVQPAHEITASFASGAMSHGALVAKAHEAVAQGTNIAGAMSNSGEGGEHSRRYNSVKASKIKQFASGRFGVWTGYLADPSLQEIEIKIAQGAKPGEGGQLPAAKVNVEIAAARGGTPGVELVSPPPHHDTYSIEDLGQLIHDAKAARVKVIVKLVSSEGVGTIAVGVAKAGADLINIAGNTGGTGAAQVTSLKNTGRAAEIGIAEVHQALSENGLRDKVVLRCSNAHQTGLDVIKSAMLGGDSFEFGTTALMMLKCVMAKNCNVKCPAGLTTNPEVYQGDPRALAQYFINLAHEVREILASLGFSSLRALRGRADLLHLINHPSMVGQLDMTGMLRRVDEVIVDHPVYLEANFEADDRFIEEAYEKFFADTLTQHVIEGPNLHNRNKSTGGQFSIDVERYLNYELTPEQRANHPAIDTLQNGRVVLREDSLVVKTYNSAGQSYAAFNNSGITMDHTGTCNDGVGKGASGGRIIVRNPGGGADADEGNVLVGNFALFGASGGELFVRGQAGDRFGVRNSGAVAVVEGVGDFCCEYMTNGSIINLGSYGKGFGNGMSGGSAYQYDPSGDIVKRCSHDSVRATALAEDSELMQGQEMALRYHLEMHLQHTGSKLVKNLLDNWQESRKHFYVLIPLSLYSYHCGEAILAKMERKAILEELSQAWGTWHLRRIDKAYKEFTNDDQPIFAGMLPGYGDCDTHLICQYINAAGVLRRALEAAEKLDLVQSGAVSADRAARHLVETQDRKLLEVLFKDLKEALAGYSDEALAALLADKRVRDYKESLTLREIWDSRAWGTSVWIIARDRANQAELGTFPRLEEQLASHYSHVLAQVVRKAA
ncbi:Glutamate synthase (NADPH) large chain [Methylophaga frappieri]|uniref:Glutamate synthase (NADPH) large chain n=1 Tax=Methylophaga frappieri (strain ATCC BAA-2434 / DSM 25690 / JAM7) TaxID=754477 RepID=I1YFR0_METFJ|nr:glutamate synthase-related protein [Methylophaga frappieri]AFJ01753.1 Glutamate synthase (NADPH) large chain [Methylophaga frappieri]